MDRIIAGMIIFLKHLFFFDIIGQVLLDHMCLIFSFIILFHRFLHCVCYYYNKNNLDNQGYFCLYIVKKKLHSGWFYPLCSLCFYRICIAPPPCYATIYFRCPHLFGFSCRYFQERNTLFSFGNVTLAIFRLSSNLFGYMYRYFTCHILFTLYLRYVKW